MSETKNSKPATTQPTNPYLNEALWPFLEVTHGGNSQRHSTQNAVITTYEAKINVLTFLKGHIKKRVRIVGLPPSISLPGYGTDNEAGVTEIVDFIKRQKGHTLIINADERLNPSFSCVLTLPSVVIDNKFVDFDDYMSHLRAHYRYRILKAQKRFEPVDHKRNGPFEPALYDLYDAVYKRSEYPLIQNDLEFFRNFPAEIEHFYVEGKPIGFCQYMIADETLYFMFCGICYEALKIYDTYMNMLLVMIKRGLEAGVKHIDLGQTTETMKMKLGGELKSMNICHYHPNRMIREGMKSVMPLLGYKQPNLNFHVFKEN